MSRDGSESNNITTEQPRTVGFRYSMRTIKASHEVSGQLLEILLHEIYRNCFILWNKSLLWYEGIRIMICIISMRPPASVSLWGQHTVTTPPKLGGQTEAQVWKREDGKMNRGRTRCLDQLLSGQCHSVTIAGLFPRGTNDWANHRLLLWRSTGKSIDVVFIFSCCDDTQIWAFHARKSPLVNVQ